MIALLMKLCQTFSFRLIIESVTEFIWPPPCKYFVYAKTVIVPLLLNILHSPMWLNLTKYLHFFKNRSMKNSRLNGITGQSWQIRSNYFHTLVWFTLHHNSIQFVLHPGNCTLQHFPFHIFIQIPFENDWGMRFCYLYRQWIADHNAS